MIISWINKYLMSVQFTHPVAQSGSINSSLYDKTSVPPYFKLVSLIWKMRWACFARNQVCSISWIWHGCSEPAAAHTHHLLSKKASCKALTFLSVSSSAKKRRPHPTDSAVKVHGEDLQMLSLLHSNCKHQYLGFYWMFFFPNIP